MANAIVNADPKPSRRYAEYVRKIQCDEWTILGLKGGDKVVIQHTSGVTQAYGTHDGGNDWNGPRNFALGVQRACGCRLIEPRGRKRSRKTVSAVDPQVEASRRRHGDQWDARADEREAAKQLEMNRRAAADRAAADDRRRREIEELMR